jgi:DNA-binding PadR family transcriptional regulator
VAEILGTFEQAVLLAVIRLSDDAYGRAILKEVETRLARSVAAGASHATLTRLEDKGLLTSRLGPGTPIRAGRARRYYRVTALGVESLNDARTAVESIWRGLKWPLEKKKAHA